MTTLTGQECAAMARKAVALAKKKKTAPAAAERLSHLASQLTGIEVLISRPDMLTGHYGTNGNGQMTEAKFLTGQAAKDMAEKISRPAAGTGKLAKAVREARQKQNGRIQHRKHKRGSTLEAVQQAFRKLRTRDAKVSELAKVLKPSGITASNITQCLAYNEDEGFKRMKPRGWWRVQNIQIK